MIEHQHGVGLANDDHELHILGDALEGCLEVPAVEAGHRALQHDFVVAVFLVGDAGVHFLDGVGEALLDDLPDRELATLRVALGQDEDDDQLDHDAGDDAPEEVMNQRGRHRGGEHQHLFLAHLPGVHPDAGLGQLPAHQADDGRQATEGQEVDDRIEKHTVGDQERSVPEVCPLGASARHDVGSRLDPTGNNGQTTNRGRSDGSGSDGEQRGVGLAAASVWILLVNRRDGSQRFACVDQQEHEDQGDRVSPDGLVRHQTREIRVGDSGQQAIRQLHAKALVELEPDTQSQRSSSRRDGRDNRHVFLPLGGVLVIAAESRDAENGYQRDGADQHHLRIGLVQSRRDFGEDAEEAVSFELHPQEQGDLLDHDAEADGRQHSVDHRVRKDHEGAGQLQLAHHHLDQSDEQDAAKEDGITHLRLPVPEGHDARVERRGQARGAGTNRHVAAAQERDEQASNDAGQHAGDGRGAARESDRQVKRNADQADHQPGQQVLPPVHEPFQAVLGCVDDFHLVLSFQGVTSLGSSVTVFGGDFWSTDQNLLLRSVPTFHLLFQISRELTLIFL